MSSLFTRRQMLKVGILGAGLTLSDILKIRSEQGDGRHFRSGIFIFLEGGPSHQDIFDLKPNAPREIRGAFSPIKTNVDGIEICEHLPRLAQRADKFAIIRGVTHNLADHGVGKRYLLTGNRPSQTISYPEYGSVVSNQFPSRSNLPSYVSIDESFAGPGYLGAQFSPLTAVKPKHGFPYNVRGISLEDGLTVEKYKSQNQLLSDLDTTFQGFESLNDQVQGLDKFTTQAYDIISSSATRNAFNLSQEPEAENERFGKHEFGQSLILASRLIEAGVHFVTIRFRPAEFDFDTHQNNFSRLKKLLIPMDLAISGLLDRLDERGLLNETAIFASGEFGRTPKINKQGGRDHWARASCAFMAGGGITGGQVIGNTDSTASEPDSVGFSPEDLAATFYHNLGISPKTEFRSNVGRPMTLISNGRVIKDLF